jgi:hypothetical protein
MFVLNIFGSDKQAYLTSYNRVALQTRAETHVGLLHVRCLLLLLDLDRTEKCQQVLVKLPNMVVPVNFLHVKWQFNFVDFSRSQASVQRQTNRQSGRSNRCICATFHCERTNLPTYLEKWIVALLVKKFPSFYRNLRFMTVFKAVHHWNLSSANLIQSTHCYLPLWFYLPFVHSCKENKIYFDPMNRSLTHGAEPFLRSRQLCSHSSISQHFETRKFITGPNILLNTLSLCSSLNARDQVSYPYRTTGKIRVSVF